MTNNSPSSITREKHLDHMVKVVPLIVAAYAVQCYLISNIGPVELAVDGLVVLGVCLIGMTSCFITYDLTHIVNFNEKSVVIEVKWLGYEKTIHYEDIVQVDVSDPGQSFGTLRITTRSGKKYGFYFIDDADKIKTWLEQKRFPELQNAA